MHKYDTVEHILDFMTLKCSVIEICLLDALNLHRWYVGEPNTDPFLFFITTSISTIYLTLLHGVIKWELAKI